MSSSFDSSNNEQEEEDRTAEDMNFTDIEIEKNFGFQSKLIPSAIRATALKGSKATIGR